MAAAMTIIGFGAPSYNFSNFFLVWARNGKYG